MRVERIGNAALYLGDCLEILPTLPKVDAVITDPPYGIDCDEAIHCTKPDRPNTYITPPKYSGGDWDYKPSRACFEAMQRASDEQIIWGGNYFADMLPASRGWLFWDKMFDKTTNFSHGELAWTSLDVRLQKFTMSSKAETRGGQNRTHPTQKPVALMAWCLRFVSAKVVLDPFMGSGTTGVAAMQLGKAFIGIEIEPKYFDIACERIANAQRQQPLFEPPTTSEARSMSLDYAEAK